jgi:hypothetical protein
MKKRWIILLTIFATLAVEALLLQSQMIRGVLLDRIDPGPLYDGALVLTNAVNLKYNGKKVGELQAGQILFAPSRQDVWLTEPFDPRMWKIYVEFEGSSRWGNFVAPIEQAGAGHTNRQILTLEANTGSQRTSINFTSDGGLGGRP